MKLFQSISTKLVFALVAAGALSTILSGQLAYFTSLKPAEEHARLRLAEASTSRASGLEAYSESVLVDLQLLSSSREIKAALQMGTEAFETVGSDTLNSAYVGNNPKPLGERHVLDRLDGDGAYGEFHASHHPGLRRYWEAKGYYDVFLLDAQGWVVYSVAKEADFATNLIDGPYANSGLGDVFKGAREAGAGQHAFSDMRPYAPSANVPATFAAMPVFDSSGAFMGAVAVQLSIETISFHAEPHSEIDETTSYVIGPDNVFRTEVSQIEGSEVGEIRHNAERLGTALEMPGMDGDTSFVAVTPVSFLGADWRFVTEVPRSVALAEVTTFRSNMLMLLAPMLLVLCVAAYFAGRSLASPFEKINASVTNMAAGDLDTELPFTDRPDEVGQIAARLEMFRTQLKNAAADDVRNAEREDALRKEQEAMLEDLRESIGSVVGAVTDGRFDTRVTRQFDDPVLAGLAEGVNRICEVVGGFVGAIETAVEALADKDLTTRVSNDFSGKYQDVGARFNAAVENLQQTVCLIGQSSDQMSETVSEVENGSQELAGRAVAQASSLEETAASMEQIAQGVATTAGNAQTARNLVTETENSVNKGRNVVDSAVKAMDEIEQSSQKIADIVSIIDGIAFQTNLLALNAAVEAARAGDAGKGFAVVASEVRTLAQRSSDAAKDIGELIGTSSEKVNDGVRLVNATGEALADISGAIQGFSESVMAISQAMDEQRLSTSEISESISQMDAMTQKNAGMADASASAMQSISELAESLSVRMKQFEVGTVAAAMSAGAQFGRPLGSKDSPTAPAPTKSTSPAPLAASSAKSSEGMAQAKPAGSEAAADAAWEALQSQTKTAESGRPEETSTGKSSASGGSTASAPVPAPARAAAGGGAVAGLANMSEPEGEWSEF